MEIAMTDAPTGCCPKFDSAPWNEKTFTWENKRFVKARVFTFFYVPINFGGVIRRLVKLCDAAGADTSDHLCLSDHTSKWNMDIYLAVDKEVPGARNVTLSGTYLSKAYEGDFKETGKWCKDFNAYITSKSLKLLREFMWYTTCPKCAKAYGKNPVVIVGQVA
jgi:hypothetical protein